MEQNSLSVNVGSEYIKTVFGQFDCYAKKIEETLDVALVTRNDRINVLAEKKEAAESAVRVLEELVAIAEKGEDIPEQKVDYLLSLSARHEEKRIREVEEEILCHTVHGKPVMPKTLGQKQYVQEIRDKMIVFGVGPAGTGKTYLAMACAITAFRNEEVGRIVLTRPAIEAGERLGFLPGDMQSKVDPYLRPLYDALYQIMGAESFAKNMEKGLIEVAPLAYMRGRTLDNAFVILDEAQNTTPAQMKMFLTRIGFHSKAIITGDLSQKDLPEGKTSGLDQALMILKNVKEIGICRLSGEDVVRHPLVQRIVKAYDEYEKKGRKAADKARGKR